MKHIQHTYTHTDTGYPILMKIVKYQNEAIDKNDWMIRVKAVQSEEYKIIIKSIFEKNQFFKII